MARPSREELQDRQKKIDSGRYKRDNEYYLKIENHLSDSSIHEKSYKFCVFCRVRDGDYWNREEEGSDTVRGDWSFNIETNSITVVPTATVYWALVDRFGMSIKSFLRLADKCMYTTGLLNFHRLIEELSTEEIEEIIDLSIEDFTTEICTLIRPQRYNIIQPNETAAVSKKAYIEIDLSKSIEDIIEVITEIKKSFDKDDTLVYNPLEALGYDIKPFTCNIKDCDIFKHKSPKPLEGKMTDLLYIYDSKRAGLNNQYIIDEVTRYWKDIKKISTESFFHFDEYYKQAKELIDDKKHKDYLTGVTVKPPLQDFMY